jgi:hypothetical protein
MAYKVFLLSDNRSVTIYKRKSARSLRITLGANGQVKVSIPIWVSYKAGLEFVRSKEEWIKLNHKIVPLLTNGQSVGKAHHLQLLCDASKSNISCRVTNNSVLITYPSSSNPNDPEVQKVAQKACIRALRTQAESLLPQRLDTLASKHNFRYNSVSIKHLKSRWGSCDQNTDIVLNLFLMQVPWELIDYVLIHELTHTQILRHGHDFWVAMEKVLPDVKPIKQQLRNYQPILNGSLGQAMT